MRLLPDWLRYPKVLQRENPVGPLLSTAWEQERGVGTDWMPSNYGDYFAQSVPVYSAIKIRQDAIARVRLQVFSERGDEREPVGRDHPAQRLLDRPNPFWTRGQLWRATETYLGLWGSAFWSLVRGPNNEIVEIWPLRPDRVRVIPDPQEYVSGFLYTGERTQKSKALLPEEVVWFRYFNPKDEYAGLSPIAPLRLSADMGRDALRTNRNTLTNDATTGLIIQTEQTPSPEQRKEFWQAWAERHQGVNKSRRPAILGAGMTATNMGFSPREMEFLQSMLWSLGDTARAFNIPLPMLHDLSRATYSNIATARRSFWEDCIVPQLTFYAEHLNVHLLPALADPNLSLEFDTSQVEALQEDEDKKATRRKIYISAGVMTPNEVREEMGLPQSDDPQADELQFGSAGFGFSLGGDGEPREFSPLDSPSRVVVDWEAEGQRAFDNLRISMELQEKRFARVMRDLFSDQFADMLRQLNERALVPDGEDVVLVNGQPEITVAGWGKGLRHNGSRDPGDPGTTGGLNVFDPEAWHGRTSNIALRHLTLSMVGAAGDVIEQFNLGVAFYVTRPLPRAWLQERAKWFAGIVNQHTADSVMSAIRQANEAGESIPQIADRLRNVRDIATDVRARRIARTEITAAQSQGHIEAFQEADVEGKQWWTAQDERVREAHQGAHGQIRRVREEFDVGGEKLPAPGQGGSAGNVINCRCVPLPYFGRIP